MSNVQNPSIIPLPIGSICMVYMLTWLGYIDGKCGSIYIYSIHGSYGLYWSVHRDSLFLDYEKIPNILGSIIPFDHQPTRVLNTVQVSEIFDWWVVWLPLLFVHILGIIGIIMPTDSYLSEGLNHQLVWFAYRKCVEMNFGCSHGRTNSYKWKYNSYD